MLLSLKGEIDVRIDLTGQKFNRLTVVQRSEEQRKTDAVLWDCICECGTKTTATTNELRSGHKKSCGCLKKEPKADNLTGMRFGRLTVRKRVGTTADRKPIWRCNCDCGKKTDVRACDLKSGNTRSCGCLGNHFAQRNLMEGGFYEKKHKAQEP